MPKRFILSLFLFSAVMPAFSQGMQDLIHDSLALYIQNKQADLSFLDKATMSNPLLSAYPKVYNPKLKIQMLDSSELLSLLAYDKSRYKIVLLWACWSGVSVSEMIDNKYLFDSKKYDVYAVSADLNNDKQRDSINGFLGALGVSDHAYQINSKIDITDMQNGKATEKFISSMLGQTKGITAQNICGNMPYAIIYDSANKLVTTMNGHFSFSALAKYKRK